jgi:polyhydroxyalkanoate synthase
MKAGARVPSPEQYLRKVEPVQGSWWPTFAAWLAEHSMATKVAPPKMGAAGYKPVCDAPGEYVLVR